MANDPRPPLQTPGNAHADLDLLLVETDREDPILAQAGRAGAPSGEDAIDEQILAGLVSP
jgi:hypothetical protein